MSISVTFRVEKKLRVGTVFSMNVLDAITKTKQQTLSAMIDSICDVQYVFMSKIF